MVHGPGHSRWSCSTALAVPLLGCPVAAGAAPLVTFANGIQKLLDVAGHRIILEKGVLVRVVPGRIVSIRNS